MNEDDGKYRKLRIWIRANMRENDEGADMNPPIGTKSLKISYIHLQKTSIYRYNKQKYKKSQNKMTKNHKKNSLI